MTSNTIPLVTVAEIEEYAAITNTGASSGSIASSYLSLARLAPIQIEKFCRVSLLRESVIEYFPTKATQLYSLNLDTPNDVLWAESARIQRLYLKKINIDLEEDFLVYYDQAREWNASSLIPSSDYFVNTDTGLLTLEFPTAFSMKALKVVYTGGFASAGDPLTLSASAPDDLKMACINQVIFMYNTLNSQDAGMEPREQTRNKFIRPGFMTDNAMQLITPYKRFYTGRYA